jgi:nicotinamidase-related amidase
MSMATSTGAVISLRASMDPAAVPTLVLIDLQEEYIAAPRALALPHARPALDACRGALTHARTMGFPIAFMRWVGRSPFFNPATRFSQWIEGFEPTAHDMVFERKRPSCYANSQFAEVMSLGGGSNLVIAGFAGPIACLSTVIDAFHHGHRTTFLTDASASYALGDVNAADAHRLIARVIGLYARVMTTEEWVAATSREWGSKGAVYGYEQERGA